MVNITNNEFLQSVLENEAWQKLSEEEALSMEMLEKYQEQLDWSKVSENRNILWSVDGLRKFGRKLRWSEFSQYCNDSIICMTTLQEFKSKWDWKALSDREAVYNNWSMLETFADIIDWATVISNWNIDKPAEFFQKFQEHIPMAKLQDSRIWIELVEKRSKELMNEMLGIK